MLLLVNDYLCCVFLLVLHFFRFLGHGGDWNLFSVASQKYNKIQEHIIEMSLFSLLFCVIGAGGVHLQSEGHVSTQSTPETVLLSSYHHLPFPCSCKRTGQVSTHTHTHKYFFCPFMNEKISVWEIVDQNNRFYYPEII